MSYAGTFPEKVKSLILLKLSIVFLIYSNTAGVLRKFLFPDHSGMISHQSRRHKTLLLLLLPCSLLTINYPIPTNVKEVCLFVLLFIQPRDLPTLLSPASLIYRQWFSCDPPSPLPSIIMYEKGCKTAILWNIFSIL